MKATIESLGIDRLTTEEQLRLVHAIWDHIAASAPKPMLSDAQREDLRHRIADDDARPDELIPWEQIEKRAKRSVFE